MMSSCYFCSFYTNICICIQRKNSLTHQGGKELFGVIGMISFWGSVYLGSIETFILKNGQILPWILGSIAIVVLFISYYISVKIYSKKEF